jgi:ABC-type branched-subunit amino acid transport system permease subunit
MKLDLMSAVGLILTGLLMLAVAVFTPALLGVFQVMQFTVFAAMSILALSLAFVWGYSGILSFGQAAFFGLGAYAYAVASIDIGESTLPILIAIALPAIFALLLGYFIFYGRLSDVYLAVVTLAVTLVLFSFISSTAGDAYRIGSAHLNGFNGIPSVPPINIPGRADLILTPDQVFYLTMACLMGVYFGLRAFLASDCGRVLVAIRENETRAGLLGYDVRRYKLAAFVIGAAIAGLSGCLFANWGAFVSPDVFSLASSAQIIMWVIIGGLGTLIGPIVGCLLLQYLATILGTQQIVNTNLAFGAILVASVLLMPKGIFPSIGVLMNRSPLALRLGFMRQ